MVWRKPVEHALEKKFAKDSWKIIDAKTIRNITPFPTDILNEKFAKYFLIMKQFPPLKNPSILSKNFSKKSKHLVKAYIINK